MVCLRDRPTLKPEWLRQLTATPRPLRPPWLLGARASPRESVWGSLSPTPRRAGISAPLGPPLRVPRGEQKESEKLEVAKRMLWLQAPLFQGCASFPSPHLYVTAHSVNTLMAPGPKQMSTHSGAREKGQSHTPPPETRHIRSYSPEHLG